MTTVTIIMVIATLALVPLQLRCNAHIDLDEMNCVIVIRLFGMVFFDCTVGLNGGRVIYSGSIDGELDIDSFKGNEIGIKYLLDNLSINVIVNNKVNDADSITRLLAVRAVMATTIAVLNDSYRVSGSSRVSSSNSITINMSMTISTVSAMAVLLGSGGNNARRS